MSEIEYVNVDMEYQHETDHALLVTDSGDVAHWIPKSQIEEMPSDAGPGDNISIRIPEWLANKKGLI